MKGRKERCKFAKQCEIEWDGLTNVRKISWLTNVKGTC